MEDELSQVQGKDPFGLELNISFHFPPCFLIVIFPGPKARPVGR